VIDTTDPNWVQLAKDQREELIRQKKAIYEGEMNWRQEKIEALTKLILAAEPDFLKKLGRPSKQTDRQRAAAMCPNCGGR